VLHSELGKYTYEGLSEGSQPLEASVRYALRPITRPEGLFSHERVASLSLAELLTLARQVQDELRARTDVARSDDEQLDHDDEHGDDEEQGEDEEPRGSGPGMLPLAPVSRSEYAQVEAARVRRFAFYRLGIEGAILTLYAVAVLLMAVSSRRIFWDALPIELLAVAALAVAVTIAGSRSAA
jgi:hypothetical protein